MSESEPMYPAKLSKGHGQGVVADQDDDVIPHRNPITRGWNRYAAKGYQIVNNSLISSAEPVIEDGEGSTRRNKTEKQLCVLLIVSLIVISILLVILLVIALGPGQTELETCQSPDCVMIAGNMLSKMKLSADPCDDFYTYACDVAIHDPTMPPSAKKWGIFQQVQERNMAIVKLLLERPGSVYKGVNSSAVRKAKSYYKACMNVTAREARTNKPLLEIINDVGSWPLTNDSVSGSWSSQNWSMEDTLSWLFWYQTTALFTMTVGTDDKNSSIQRIVFDQGGTLFSSPTFYSSNDSLPYHDAFIKFFVTITTLLGASESLASQAAENVWHFERDLAKAFDPLEDRMDPRSYYHRMTLSELQALVGSDVIDLHKYLTQAFNETIAMSEEVIVYAVNYIPKMAALVQAADKETLATYMVWHVVVSLLPYMPLPYRLALLQLEATLSGVMEAEKDWEQCVGSTESALGFVTGALFVEENFSQQDKTDLTFLFDVIRKTFIHNIKSASWLDGVTRKHITFKADHIQQQIGYPDIVQHPANLDSYYSKLIVHESNALNNELSARFCSVQHIIRKRGKPPDKHWWDKISDVGTYYDQHTNQIVLPAGILQKPFYDKSLPRSLIFGALGMLLGHELSHSVDSQGRLFDADGNMRHWWTEKSTEAFIKKETCFVDQYNSFTVIEGQFTSINTLREYIADNMGLKTAYRSYRSWADSVVYQERPLPGLNMTDDQLFFLGFAQLWCDSRTEKETLSSLVTDKEINSKFRVVGILQNMPEFSKAYKCSASSPMNPAKKCAIW